MSLILFGCGYMSVKLPHPTFGCVVCLHASAPLYNCLSVSLISQTICLSLIHGIHFHHKQYTYCHDEYTLSIVTATQSKQTSKQTNYPTFHSITIISPPKPDCGDTHTSKHGRYKSEDRHNKRRTKLTLRCRRVGE